MTMVLIQTNFGDIKLELFKDKAPLTVENFLSYVDDGFYDGTLFHRVINGFMIQGGGFDESFKEKNTKSPIKNEANNGLSNSVGTIAMARTNVVDSATSQFFINVAENSYLDFQNESPEGYGYAVFGKVIEGQEAIDEIKSKPTHTRGFHGDVPVEDIIINKISRI